MKVRFKLPKQRKKFPCFFAKKQTINIWVLKNRFHTLRKNELREKGGKIVGSTPVLPYGCCKIAVKSSYESAQLSTHKPPARLCRARGAWFVVLHVPLCSAFRCAARSVVQRVPLCSAFRCAARSVALPSPDTRVWEREREH